VQNAPIVSKKKIKKFFTLSYECDCPYKLQGHLIKIARTNAGLSQIELAQTLGVSRRIVQSMELHGCDGVLLVKLMKILNLPPDYFNFEEE
jgi:DNA-binding transcriptional regulator YiaG